MLSNPPCAGGFCFGGVTGIIGGIELGLILTVGAFGESEDGITGGFAATGGIGGGIAGITGSDGFANWPDDINRTGGLASGGLISGGLTSRTPKSAVLNWGTSGGFGGIGGGIGGGVRGTATVGGIGGGTASLGGIGGGAPAGGLIPDAGCSFSLVPRFTKCCLMSPTTSCTSKSSGFCLAISSSL